MLSKIAIFRTMADAGAAVFKAIADSTRRQILQDLGSGELAAGEIASRFPISGPSVSRHLSVLRAAGLVAERREGNRIFYSVVEERLATTVSAFLSAVCPEQSLWRSQRSRTGTGEESEA